MATQTTRVGEPARKKPVIPAHSAINWYFGNFLMSPGNAFREEEGYDERIRKLVDDLYVEFEGQAMTHKQFLDLMKEHGIHAQFYRYQKPKPIDCPLCRLCGIR